MLIKFGSIVVGGRGTLGGQVYSHNRGGDYVRNNATPVNPQTPSQMESRALLAQFSSGWNQLSQAMINAWNAAAQNFPRTNVFGDQKFLSGKNLYTSLNKELLTVGQPAIDEPPMPQEVTVPTEISNISAMDDGTLTFDVENTAVGDQLVLIATPPVSAGTSFVKNKLRVVATMAATANTTSADIGAAYVAKFGAIEENDKIFVGAYAVNTVGQRSPQVVASGLATAAP